MRNHDHTSALVAASGRPCYPCAAGSFGSRREDRRLPDTDPLDDKRASPQGLVPREEAGHLRIPSLPNLPNISEEEERLRRLVHDLRSPIGAMKLWLHLLKTGDL